MIAMFQSEIVKSDCAPEKLLDFGHNKYFIKGSGTLSLPFNAGKSQNVI